MRPPLLLVACAFLLAQGAAQPLGAVQTSAPAGELTILELRSNFFMIAGAGGNIGVQVGEDGLVVVDAGAADRSPAVLAAIKRISPRPIRYVVNTGPDADHVGGNAALARAGQTIFPDTRQQNDFLGGAASILAAEPVLRRMSEAKPAIAAGGWPSETFHYARKTLYLNGEGIEVLRQPAAHSDGDVFVFFRRSDVVVAGDVLDTRQFPVIDVEGGGSIQGEIAALNRLVDLAISSVPIVSREAGTLIVPGHGRICDQLDVVEYRDMVTIVHDRVRDLVAAGRNLEQIKAAAPALGYAGRYGNQSGPWTTNHFIEAVYDSLTRNTR